MPWEEVQERSVDTEDSRVASTCGPMCLCRDVVLVLNVSVSSRSRSRDFSLVNVHAMRIYHEENNGSDPQETGCQVTDFTSSVQLVFLNCDTAVLIRFLKRLVSYLGLEG